MVFGQKRTERISFAVWNANDVLIPNVSARMNLFGQGQNFIQSCCGKQFSVNLCVVLTHACPCIQMGKFNVERCALESVQTTVDSQNLMIISGLHAMNAKHCNLFRQFVVVGNNHASVARRSEVFGWIKAQTAKRSHRTNAFVFPLRTNRLSGVFNNRDVKFFRNCCQRGHVCALSVQVNWNNRLGFFCNQAANACRINAVGIWKNVSEFKRCAQSSRRPCRCEKRKAGQNNFVARTNIQRHQSQQKGVCAGGARNSMFRLTIRTNRFFTLLNFRSQNIDSAFDYFFQSGFHFIMERSFRTFKVQQRNSGWQSACGHD